MQLKLTSRRTLVYCVLLLFLFECQKTPKEKSEDLPKQNGISPDQVHPQYWNYQGEAILLLGGSDEDNAFQMPEVEKHLEILKQAGGNYLRCTMSSRDSGNVWPFATNEEGLYDLRQWNETYWQRFDNFLKASQERNIIVQIELWATFDFYRDNWEVNPFNPKNNVNYSAERSKLPLSVPTHPTWTENNFFWSVPSQESNLVVLGYQQSYVDKLLSYSLKYDNVLYCMDNETSVTSEWGKFWSLYIKKVASEQGKQIFTTEMWDPHDLSHAAHRETIDHPEIYDFADISQNNHKSADMHWENGLKQLQRIATSGKVRPANNVKIYGNDGGRHQTTQNAIESFCRNVLMGCASARFHRPTSGQGLNEVAQATIKTMRKVSSMQGFFEGKANNEILLNREANEAFCRTLPDNQFIVYFTNGGEVDLDVENSQNYQATWYHVLSDETISQELKLDDGVLSLACPEEGHWVVCLLSSS